MATTTEAFDLFDKWVRDGCEYHPLLISELQSTFSEARAEVLRLRAAAGERDALREVFHRALDEIRNWNGGDALADDLERALAAVPAPPPQADDRLLTVAERAARAMQEECYITIPSAYGILRDAVHALDAAAVARRAVEEQEKP